MDGVTYTSTNRGGRLLVHQNFLYTYERTRGTTEHSRCRDRACNGRLNLQPANVVVTKEHNHPASAAAVLASLAKREIVERALSTVGTPRQVYQHVTGTLSLQAAVKLPRYTATQQAMGRKRKAQSIPLARPNTLADIDTELYLQASLREEVFLLKDTGRDDPARVIVFATKKNLEHLSHADVWLADGTFKIAPPLFPQLYTVHGAMYGCVIPLVYALLPNKNANTYTKLFQIIFDGVLDNGFGLGKPVGPATMIFDFEQAAITSSKRVYRHTKPKGCGFHFGQSNYRKIQELGLAARYGNDLDLTCTVECCWRSLMFLRKT